MLIQCPSCKARLRISQQTVDCRSVTVNCPRCGGKLRLSDKGKAPLLTLIAHEDQEVCRQLEEQLTALPVSTRICGDPREVARHLEEVTPCLLLIDVAFADGFPFELIDLAKRDQAAGHKIILLPSIYRKTAYKRRPASLYGADSYLELHHVGDCLLPLVVELFPHLKEYFAGDGTSQLSGGERSLKNADLSERTLALCRILIADIALYHQDRLAPGMKKKEARQVFGDCLAEGRQLLLQRLPEAAVLAEDYLLLAFDEFYDSYLHYQARC